MVPPSAPHEGVEPIRATYPSGSSRLEDDVVTPAARTPLVVLDEHDRRGVPHDRGWPRTSPRWRLHLRSGHNLSDLAREINPIVRGWLNYYGRFYRSGLIQSLRRIDDYLVRWAMRKYKRLRGKLSRAWDLLHAVQRRQPRLFAHWTRPQPQAG